MSRLLSQQDDGRRRDKAGRTSKAAVHDEARLDEEQERVQADHGDEAQDNGREDNSTVVEPGWNV